MTKTCLSHFKSHRKYPGYINLILRFSSPWDQLGKNLPWSHCYTAGSSCCRSSSEGNVSH